MDGVTSFPLNADGVAKAKKLFIKLAKENGASDDESIDFGRGFSNNNYDLYFIRSN